MGPPAALTSLSARAFSGGRKRMHDKASPMVNAHGHQIVVSFSLLVLLQWWWRSGCLVGVCGCMCMSVRAMGHVSHPCVVAAASVQKRTIPKQQLQCRTHSSLWQLQKTHNTPRETAATQTRTQTQTQTHRKNTRRKEKSKPHEPEKRTDEPTNYQPESTREWSG